MRSKEKENPTFFLSQGAGWRDKSATIKCKNQTDTKGYPLMKMLEDNDLHQSLKEIILTWNAIPIQTISMGQNKQTLDMVGLKNMTFVTAKLTQRYIFKTGNKFQRKEDVESHPQS